ncbi:MAG: hypothetical protein ACLR1T_12940 [Evtepia gabavorous]
MLKDIEKLLKSPSPAGCHDYPMEVFEVPVKDAKGRVVNPEDAEARQAARESTRPSGSRPPRRLRKRPPSRRTPRRTQPRPEAPPGQGTGTDSRPPASGPAAGEGGEGPADLPPRQAESGESGGLPGRPACGGGRGVLSHRDPLEGRSSWTPPPGSWRPNRCTNTISPARPTASGEKGTKAQGPGPAGQTPAPEKTPKAAQAAQTREAPKKGAPAPAKKGTGALGRPAARSGRGRGRIPPRVEPPKSRQKDSTEQKSLMKPFYIDHD